MTRIRNRLPSEVHSKVFEFVRGIAAREKLLHGKTVAVDATTLQDNTDTMMDRVMQSQTHLHEGKVQSVITRVPADKGHHSARNPGLADHLKIRIYILDCCRPNVALP